VLVVERRHGQRTVDPAQAGAPADEPRKGQLEIMGDVALPEADDGQRSLSRDGTVPQTSIAGCRASLPPPASGETRS
jgi:hypothetical protein